jgi:asparagine synthase (glutamine-hydrolysing)
MPGIVGIIDKEPHRENQSTLDLMVDCMKHETFYTSGTYVEDRLGLWLGWTNHAGSFSDCLPIWNENRDVCLIFSGEEYADPAEIDSLRARGHRFNSDDASYLVHLYEEQGPEFLQKLNGLFSGLIVDLRVGKAILFNDRYGLNRIYYHQNERGFYFASEAKSLLRVLPSVRSLDLVGLGEFLSCGCVLQNRSLFSGLSLLPGGSAWSFSVGKPVLKASFFDRSVFEQYEVLGSDEYYQRLKETWERILTRYLRGPRAFALALTGGVDSRMILAWARQPSGTLPCYTYAGTRRDCEDVKISRQVAKICGQPHSLISLDGDFLSAFPSLAERVVYLSDGATEVKGTCDLFAQQVARKIAPDRLSGVYGGEILRRLVAFKPIDVKLDLYSPELARAAQEAPKTYRLERDCHPLSFTAFKQAPWHIFGPLCPDRSQVVLRSPYLDNELVDLAYRTPPELVEQNELSLRLAADGNPALKGIPTDRGLTLPAIPMLSKGRHLFQEFTFKAEYAYDYGMPQWLAATDSAVAPLHLERLFLGRHKFSSFRVWYRDQFSTFIKDILLDPRTKSRPYLNRRELERVVEGHTRGYRNYTTEIHKLLTMELIQRQLIEKV